ncbi:hypothetical protein LOH54_01100 [Sulfurimonas sp. HSL-3221]|uniref:hypothetical protein n=1 Tax=Sulfurimonadaceae TaxID=2771471 RepID=UPI001E61352F|nr:hypothetical protein [Sulfurimonas sp. HSL-3221]UFS62740.1 hypothetical protein LOH54_01100 [Sulfurimonas sp. HSL-3221]
MIRHFSKQTSLLLLSGVSLAFIGCNSGDSDHQASVNIDTSNQQLLVATLFDSIDSTTPQLPSVKETKTPDPSSMSYAEALASIKGESDSKKETVSTCSGGGMIYSNGSEGSAELSYENCVEGTTTTNGKITVIYDDTTGSVSYTLSDYSLENSSTSYKTPKTTYTLSSGHIAYVTSGERTIDGKKVEFDQYKYALDIVGDTMRIAVNGYLKTDAVGDWMGVKTEKAMQFKEGVCPDSGDMALLGSGSTLELKFSEDHSIGLYLNDELTKSFGDCNVLPVLSEAGA